MRFNRFLVMVIAMFPASLTLKAQNTGIGTTSPLMKLHVSHTDSALVLAENSGILGNNTSTGLYFKNGSYFTGAVKTTGTGPAFARLGFFTYATPAESGLVERMSIADDGNVGIGTTIPAAKLEVNGNIRITGGIPGEGKVLTSDVVGTGTWQLPAGSNTGFKAVVGTGGFNVSSSTNTTIIFTSEEYDDPSAFFSTVFVAPATALYHFDVMVTWDVAGVAIPTQYYLGLQVNGTDRHRHFMQLPAGSGNGPRTQAFSAELKLFSGQSVSLYANQNSGIIQNIMGDTFGTRHSYFSGRRVY